MAETTPAKAAARAAARLRRAACNPALGAQLAGHVLQNAPPPGAIIAGYWPIGSEIDIRPLLVALAARGHALCLPETPPRGQPLSFRLWQPEARLVPGRFATQHPTGPVLTPDYVLLPLLAFDAQGRRLGYGGGYYDRTLAALPNAFRLGCAFAAQEIPAVPADAHDLKLQAVATEHYFRPISPD